MFIAKAFVYTTQPLAVFVLPWVANLLFVAVASPYDMRYFADAAWIAWIVSLINCLLIVH